VRGSPVGERLARWNAVVTEPPRSQPLGFFSTPPHNCGYLPGQRAVTLFVDPRMRPDIGTYTLLSQHGFRRSGGHIYRPKCPSCEACIPIRLPVAEFRPRRSQRRNLRINADISVSPREPAYDPLHFNLYHRYITARHTGGGMENPDPGSYMDFLTANWATTTFYEFKNGPELLAVAVVDRLDDGLSAVYTFFDPAHPYRSLGHYAILKEIEIARELGLKWLYLGYWIAECRKMSYKTDFTPHQCYVNGAWRHPSEYRLDVRREKSTRDGSGD
jgi:leucyl-tRNA---protein transferase